MVAEQVFDNALIAANLLDDPRSMLVRINTLVTQALADTPEPPTSVAPKIDTPPAAGAGDSADGGGEKMRAKSVD